MTKKMLLISLLVSFLYAIPSIAQEYDHKIKVTITITDEIIPTRPASIIQHHTLSFEKHPNFVFEMNDQVGFEFYIDNQSLSGKTFHYRVGYSPRNGETIFSEEEIPTGVLTPIILPPVDDEDDEAQNAPVNPYPYTIEGEYLDWGTRLGFQSLRVFLSIKNEHNDTFMYNSEISNIFRTIISNETPVDGVKAKNTKTDLILYPNPLDTHLHIKLANDIKNKNTTAALEVYTMQGILLKKSLIKPNQIDHNLQYDFTNPPTLKRGTYIYKITIQGETYIKMLQKK
ncbi:T9SS type A sorting domain-containing protein [Dokdonia sp.]|uniref:T9SS type A sorting domain-containing protein n=1 Tax=Dokdonia sp. TaxID=2024995 RepID=UPI003267E9FF